MDSLLSAEQEDRVITILNQVSELSESEKHVLYLKLPDESDESSSSKEQSNLTLRWIKTHYIEDRDICVPKEDVYKQYREHCETSGDVALNSYNFGKMMKLVFPKIHDRRLGQRGQSKYCYGGLRRKSSSPVEVLSIAQTKEDDSYLYDLSCQLVCEWATQLLGKPFVDIMRLSEYLVSKGLSCGKTAAKFSLFSGSTSPPKRFDKGRKSPNSKHHDRQMLLQRKLRHNKLIREHKEKLKQQQNQMWEQCSAATGIVRPSSDNPPACPLRLDEQINTLPLGAIAGRKVQLRPSSVQPYLWCVNSSHVNKKQLSSSTHGIGFEREPMSGVSSTNLGHYSTQAMSTGPRPVQSAKQELSVGLREHLLESFPPKRCHSTSVVEKQSSSLHFGMLELTGKPLGKCPSSIETNSGCEMDDGKMSSSLSSSLGNSSTPIDIHVISSSSECLSTGMSPLASVLPSLSSHRNFTKLLESPVSRVSMDGLLMPQHPKRYGDSISPDRSSLTKRKCMTSLGVTKQQSLETSNTSSESLNSDHPRLRPYSCPVSANISQFDAVLDEGKSLSSHLFAKSIRKEELSDSKENLTGQPASRGAVTSSPAPLSERRKYDDRRKTRPEQQKKNVSVSHFVQKPTVINRPKHSLHTMTSCPDLKQALISGDVSHQLHESNTEKQSYNILNSLLSSNYDILMDPKASVKTLPPPELPSPLSSSYVSTLTTMETSKPILQCSQLRLMTNSSQVTENPSILTSLSSRSAFVPVTSHKLQAANSNVKETETAVSSLSSQKQSAAMIRKKDQDLVVPSSIPQSAGFLSTDSVHTLVKPTISHAPVNVSSTNIEYSQTQDSADIVSMKFDDYSTTVTSSTSSSSSSSSSTLCRSGESTSSGCDSVLTTPIPAHAAGKSDEASQVSASTVSVKNSVIVTTSSVPSFSTVAQCNSSPSVGCTTPVMSPLICPGSQSFQAHTSSSITPPKRTSRNRFTPIRPKLGGGTNTPSPQKLGGITIPSPQKKDIRPDIKPDMRLVSAILKEQRLKCAQDLLVNLANNYQGEVKLQMPAEFLGLSPAGKSKSSDVRVTIRSPSNSGHTLQHKNIQPGSSDLNKQSWPLTSPTPPHKEITVVVEPVSLPATHSTTSPALSSCLISATPAQLLQSLPSPVGVQIVPHSMCNSTLLPKTFISSNATLQSQLQQASLTLPSVGSGAQVIILPPASLPSGQIVGNNPSHPIIVEDDKGNMYSLDQKSGFTVLPQNLQQCLKSCQSAESTILSNSNTTFFNNSSSLLNVSEIKGHVIGPDADGQTYLLVPNSEPVISATPAPGLLSQDTSPTLASSGTLCQMGSLPNISSTETIQPNSTPSSAFLSVLSQLAGQNLSGQTLIKHDSGSSAFHKCSSSTLRRAGNIGESFQLERIKGECNDHLHIQSSNYQPSENNFSKTHADDAGNDNTSQEAVEEVSKDVHGCEDISSAARCQGMRKRKASNNQDEGHEDRKRLNSSRGQREEDDDDVFIVKIEDNAIPKSVNVNSDLSESDSGPAELLVSNYPSLSPPNCDQTAVNTSTIDETKADSKNMLTDTETLLEMIGDSKSMTVKETIRAINKLRAKQSENVSKIYSTTGIDDPMHKERLCLIESTSCQELNLSSQTDVCGSKNQLPGGKSDAKSVIIARPQSARCSSVSPYPTSDISVLSKQDIAGCPHVNISKAERTGRRHISLNLESLESDALLDTELTLDQRLVGDIKDASGIKSDQKTSVGIAAKSARSVSLFLSSDRISDCKNRSRHNKRDIKSSQNIHLTDKTELLKESSSLSQKELTSNKTMHTSAVQDCVKQEIKSQQQTLTINSDETKSEVLYEKSRKMSCVRDLLQHGTKHGFLKCLSAIGDKVKSELSCQNMKALSMSNLNQTSSSGSKASEHPLLAQCLSIPSRKVFDVHMEAAKHQTSTHSSPLPEDHSSSTEQNATNTVPSKRNLPENELPGDIADFITESMSCGNLNSRDAFRGHSLSALLADLVRNGQNERDQKCASDGQNVMIWRSISVPNTIPDACYGLKIDNRQKDEETSQTHPASCIKSQSTSENASSTHIIDRQAKQFCSSEQSPLPLQLSWNNVTDPHGTAHFNLNPENLKEKDLFLEQPAQSSDGGVSLSSGTFLSPIGPAKLTRRSSVERSSSGERSLTKTPVEGTANKCTSDRSMPRVRTHTERTMTKVPGDRSVTKTPVDKSLSMTPSDRTTRKITRDKSPNKLDNPCRDHITAAVLQQSAKERDAHKFSANRTLTTSPADKILTNVCEGFLGYRPQDVMTHQGPSECVAPGDRSRNQTPMSDAGYSSVSQTPISEVGYSSVSPSPVMMSIPGLFGECGRQELASPASIFMPLRSDSVMSLVNNSKSNDGVDCILGLSSQTGPQGGPFRSVSDITQCLHRAGEEDNEKRNIKTFLFDKDDDQKESLLQDIIDATLLDHVIHKNDVESDIKRTPDSHSIRDTLSYIDFEKFMSVQLNCIPTPPCSPSASPQHLADTSQSPLSFSVPFSQSLPPPHARQSWVTPASSVSSYQMTQFSTAATMSNHVSCYPSNSIYVMSSNPGLVSCGGQHSPSVPPNILPSSYAINHTCTSPQQYNPHPSPPFTPSLQRCLASPRCPTPCSHRSLMSPCCATLCGDPNSAPNRFMPIQTSGILATSLTATQTYIQPIRPVVTLASMANQNSHTSLDFPQTKHHLSRTPSNITSPSHTETAPTEMLSSSYKQNSNVSLKRDTPSLDFPTCTDRLKFDMNSKEDDTFCRQRKVKTQQKLREDQKSERSSHPALVLSLTGSIGSVSGQGMQAGWSKDINGPASPSSSIKKGHTISSYPLHPQYWKSRFDRLAPDTNQVQALEQPRDSSPAYREMISLNLLDMCSASLHHRNSIESVALPSSTSQGSFEEDGRAEDSLHIRGHICETSLNDGEVYHKQLPLSRNNDTLSHINENPKQSLRRENKHLFSRGMNSPHSDPSDFPFSLQLAKLRDKSRPVSRDQQLPAEDSKPLGTISSHDPFHEPLHDHLEAGTTRSSVLSTMLRAFAYSSSQSQQSGAVTLNTDHIKSKLLPQVSDLPTAYYSGTAPNVDLTKTPYALSNIPVSLTSQLSPNIQHSRTDTQAGVYFTDLSSHLDKQPDCTSENQDELDETLNVLKSLDSQYFQHDDDSNNPETTL